MNMGKNNVFLDVAVPKVVQEKIDAAFLIIKTERENTMRKEQTIEKRTENTENRKSKGNVKQRKFTATAVAAACMAAVVAAVSMNGRWEHTGADETEIFSNNSSNGIPSDMESGSDYENNIISAAEETFTLTIMGAELEKDKPVQLVSDNSLITEKYAGTWMLEEMETGGVSYCINVPFTCRGNNIKSITYSINNGAFQIIQPEKESIIVDGQFYDGELNTGIIGGRDDGGKIFEMLFYQSFTLDYQKQSDENTWINICNERPDNGELKSMIFGDSTLENKNLGIRNMLDNTIITCTVHYADGTSKSADVLVNSCIMTCAEAGAEIKDDPNREEIFITFELK